MSFLWSGTISLFIFPSPIPSIAPGHRWHARFCWQPPEIPFNKLLYPPSSVSLCYLEISVPLTKGGPIDNDWLKQTYKICRALCCHSYPRTLSGIRQRLGQLHPDLCLLSSLALSYFPPSLQLSPGPLTQHFTCTRIPAYAAVFREPKVR